MSFPPSKIQLDMSLKKGKIDGPMPFRASYTKSKKILG
jgi:hypothetical protein